MAIRISVLVPCYNETLTVRKVVEDFKKVLPDAEIYVYDNNSTDDTNEKARLAGAFVCKEPLQGKGNVVRRMFADIDADVYVLVDGDATYDAPSAVPMIQRLLEGQLDMVVGCRKEEEGDAYPSLHRFGNIMFTKTISLLFGRSFTDILSGYRVFSRRFVKSFPAESQGFEIETELSIYSLQMRLRTEEMVTPYYRRPDGSESKLNTFYDGWQIFKLIFNLVLSERPVLFFGILSIIALLAALTLFLPVFGEYLETGIVPRFPSLIVAGAFGLASLTLFCFGLLFDRTAQIRREMRRLFYVFYK